MPFDFCKKIASFLLLFLFQFTIAFGQKNNSNTMPVVKQPIDSLGIKLDSNSVANNLAIKSKDTLLQNHYKFNTKQPIPKRAAFYSALLPGLGQTYNKQYWKLPIVYGGAAVSTYYFATTYKEYQTYRKAFIERTDNNPTTIDSFPNYTSSDLRELERFNRSRLDKIVVYSALFYGVNIVDALVSAHLKNFDVSKNISMQILPSYMLKEKMLAVTCRFTF